MHSVRMTNICYALIQGTSAQCIDYLEMPWGPHPNSGNSKKYSRTNISLWMMPILLEIS